MSGVTSRGCRPGLLHIHLPKTVRRAWECGGVEGALVRFALSGRRLAALARNAKHPRLEADLERVWRDCGLRSAALVYDAFAPGESIYAQQFRAALRPPVLFSATDPKLVLNVLGRACGGLLLASGPLSLERDWLARELWSDDPRIVAIARASGVERIR